MGTDVSSLVSGITYGHKPRRIQRRRTKGWRMPDGCVYVGRPTKWGNPYTVAEYGRSEAVSQFEQDMRRVLDGYCLDCKGSIVVATRIIRIAEILDELHGKDLCCWCPISSPCHGDVLLELANR